MNYFFEEALLTGSVHDRGSGKRNFGDVISGGRIIF